MADLRRWIFALAVLSLLAGLASAQVSPGPSQMTCSVNAIPNQARNEGFTELIGDILITCTGGTPVPAGSPVPQVNLTVNLTLPFTSRVVNATNAVNPVTEATLLIDEPQSGVSSAVPGWGPDQTIKYCPTPYGGCTATAATAAGGIPVSITSGDPSAPVPANAAPNAYLGISTGNTSAGQISQQITFFGVPVLPPVSSGAQRVFRLTNIRVSTAGVTGPFGASLVASNLAVLPLNAPLPSVIVAQQSLDKAVVTPTTLNLCNADPNAVTFAGTVGFKEMFASAFKTRLAAGTSTTAYAAQKTAYFQNQPGHVYYSESGLTIDPATTGLPSGLTGAIGLADFGTRLKATFSNIPAGMTLYVSLNNTNADGTAVATPNPVGGYTNPATTYAQLISSEATADGANGAPLVTTTTGTSGGVGYVVLTADSTGKATATWEVLNTNSFSNETFSFAVFVKGVTTASPNVSVSYSPIVTSNPAVVAGSPVPRFNDAGTGAGGSLFSTTNTCRTILLFPFVTNNAGFDTGIAISNTTKDPFGTQNQTGACTMYYYGSKAPSPNPVTATIAAGTTAAFTASSVAPGFQGYMIANCGFQLAHGFAFVSQFGNAFNGTMGYLPLVIPDPGAGVRKADIPVPGAGTGEQLNN